MENLEENHTNVTLFPSLSLKSYSYSTTRRLPLWCTDLAPWGTVALKLLQIHLLIWHTGWAASLCSGCRVGSSSPWLVCKILETYSFSHLSPARPPNLTILPNPSCPLSYISGSAAASHNLPKKCLVGCKTELFPKVWASVLCCFGSLISTGDHGWLRHVHQSRVVPVLQCCWGSLGGYSLPQPAPATLWICLIIHGCKRLVCTSQNILPNMSTVQGQSAQHSLIPSHC